MQIFRGLRFKPDAEIGLFGIFEMASNYLRDKWQNLPQEANAPHETSPPLLIMRNRLVDFYAGTRIRIQGWKWKPLFQSGHYWRFAYHYL